MNLTGFLEYNTDPEVYYYTSGTLNGLHGTIGTVNGLHGTIGTENGTLNGFHGTIGTVNGTLNGLLGTENGTLNGLNALASIKEFVSRKLSLFIIVIITIYLFIHIN
jgi:hypothetical protein